MAGHTPGPWPQPTKSGDGKFISIEKWGPDRDNWHRLAVEIDSDDCDSGTAMANARLIAAAPELLAFCLRFKELSETCRDMGYDAFLQQGDALMRELDAAIARATEP